MINKIKLAYQGLKIVFKNKKYISLAIILAVIFYAITNWIHNSEQIFQIASISSLTIGLKLQIIIKSLFMISNNFLNWWSFALMILVVIFFGLNISLLVYHYRQRWSMTKQAGTSLIGMVISFFGVGCAACGSVLLTILFGYSFAAALITFLPAHGAEFIILALILLLYSTYSLSRKVVGQIDCLIPAPPKEVDTLPQ
jgi:hypothetical protein